MAKGPVIAGVFSLAGFKESSAAGLDRYLRREGLRTNIGRGRSASEMTCRDVAHLIIAALGSRDLQDAADTVLRFAATRPVPQKSGQELYKATAIPELMGLHGTTSHVDAIEALLVALTTGSLRESRRARHSGGGRRPLPMIEIGASIPMTRGDLRIAGTGKKVTDVPFIIPSEPDEAHGRMTKASLRTYQDWIARGSDADFATYNRITERTLAALADALDQTEETAG